MKWFDGNIDNQMIENEKKVIYDWIEDNYIYETYIISTDGWVLSYLNNRFDLLRRELLLEYMDSNELKEIVNEFFNYIKENYKQNYDFGFDITKERLILFTYNEKKMKYNEIVFIKHKKNKRG